MLIGLDIQQDKELVPLVVQVLKVVRGLKQLSPKWQYPIEVNLQELTQSEPETPAAAA